MSKQLSSQVNFDDVGEERFYNTLIEMGIDAARIEKPDVKNDRKEPDFKVAWTIFEVKRFEPDALTVEMRETVKKNLEEKGLATYWPPDLHKSFTRQIESAARKFRNYPKHHSVLVSDMTDLANIEPSTADLISGKEKVKVNTENDEQEIAYTNRPLQIGKYSEIGAVLFLMSHRHRLYHNIMADPNRVLRQSFWRSPIGSVPCEQYAFFNLPGGGSYIRRILPD